MSPRLVWFLVIFDVVSGLACVALVTTALLKTDSTQQQDARKIISAQVQNCQQASRSLVSELSFNYYIYKVALGASLKSKKITAAQKTQTLVFVTNLVNQEKLRANTLDISVLKLKGLSYLQDNSIRQIVLQNNFQCSKQYPSF